ncbi:hypothetical protein M8C21_007927, partial [Ambrosia artemisiifolia]
MNTDTVIISSATVDVLPSYFFSPPSSGGSTVAAPDPSARTNTTSLTFVALVSPSLKENWGEGLGDKEGGAVGEYEAAKILSNMFVMGYGIVIRGMVQPYRQAVTTDATLYHHYSLPCNGMYMEVQSSRRRKHQPTQNYETSNLAWQVDNNQLEQTFNEHGMVVDAGVIFYQETTRSHDLEFVTMASETEISDAIAALDGQ